jgi:prepilin peptidase CpaA
MLATVLLLGLLLVATVTDVLRQKIYNWTTYPGILAAVGLNAAGAAVLAGTQVDAKQLAWSAGYVGPAESLIGLAACGFLMLVCYVMLKIGGGDVKLMAMVGAFLGPQDGIEAMLWTFVLGLCLAVIVLIWRVGPVGLGGWVFRRIIWRLMWWCWWLPAARWSPSSGDQGREFQSPLFLAPCALAAVVIVRLPQWGLI